NLVLWVRSEMDGSARYFSKPAGLQLAKIPVLRLMSRDLIKRMLVLQFVGFLLYSRFPIPT
ncbi:MAG: hypothetical protein ACYS8Y_14090, partial [Planctomycetota bacterium]